MNEDNYKVIYCLECGTCYTRSIEELKAREFLKCSVCDNEIKIKVHF